MSGFEITQFNAEQEAAVNAIDGDIVVIAGPGSGKTSVMARRFKNMLTRGIPMNQILNLTFTSAGAETMVERAGLLGCEKVFRTFHSYALDLVKRERAFMPFALTPEVIPIGQDFQLLKDLLKQYPVISSFRALKDKLSEWKRSNVEPEQAIEDSYRAQTEEYYYAMAYRDYEKKCREQGWLDFDSLMKETVKLLETNDEVRARNKIKYIGVDECQDTDVIQFKLLQLLYGGNIYCVGDSNQLIYEWRSAQPGNLENFSKLFPNSKTLFLGQNYRSTKKIVEFIKAITPVDNGLASHMCSEREEGTRPTFVGYSDPLQETAQVLKQITDIDNTAVIARTNRYVLDFQKACLARGIKSVVAGRKNIWEQTEVAHLLKLARGYSYQARPAHTVLKDLIEQNNLTWLYRNSGSPNEKDPTENLNDFVKMSAKRGSLAEFLEWLRKLTYGSKGGRYKKEPVLTLTTVHQAKGREWKNVFVIGCSQGMMPHKDGELLEERRIFFVACSRAADRLQISYTGAPSMFLEKFEEEIVEYEPS